MALDGRDDDAPAATPDDRALLSPPQRRDRRALHEVRPAHLPGLHDPGARRPSMSGMRERSQAGVPPGPGAPDRGRERPPESHRDVRPARTHRRHVRGRDRERGRGPHQRAVRSTPRETRRVHWLFRTSSGAIGIAAGQYWRLVSSMFLHAGILHIAFNAYALWIFGSVVEQELGRARFVLIYFVTGLVASAASYAFGLVHAVRWALPVRSSASSGRSSPTTTDGGTRARRRSPAECRHARRLSTGPRVLDPRHRLARARGRVGFAGLVAGFVVEGTGARPPAARSWSRLRRFTGRGRRIGRLDTQQLHTAFPVALLRVEAPGALPSARSARLTRAGTRGARPRARR